MRKIYLDHASTTYICKEALGAMKPYFDINYGNPSSIHQQGRKAKYAILQARNKIAKILNCQPTEIFFTGSGTESCNLAILGTAGAKKGNHIITSQVEHSAILEPCRKLEKKGFKVTYLPVDKEGMIRMSDLKKAIRPETILVSIMYANNEIGTIQPIQEIGRLLKSVNCGAITRSKTTDLQNLKSKIYFHTDACQAGGLLNLDTKKLGVDLLSLDASKIYGPKGVGSLFVREGLKIEPQILGGGQEGKLRGGTENVPGIVGMARALEIVQKNRIKEAARLRKLRDYLIKEVQKRIPKVVLNGHPQKSFKYIFF